MATTRNEHHDLKYAKSDARIITGSNVRNILLLTEKDAKEHDIKNLKCQKVAIEDSRKIDIIKELIKINNKLGLSCAKLRASLDMFGLDLYSI